jgi:leucine dehydrogenase
MRQARSLEELIEGWDGLGVVSRYDRDSGAWFFIALHDDTLGRPTGGTRINTYPTPADGLLDAMRLAQGMTDKWAVAGVPFGGGKAVVAVPGPLAGEARRRLLRRYGELVASLQGAFATGEDLGTTLEDMTEIAAVTRWVLGGHGGDGQLTDPGPFTAHGVLCALEAAACRAWGGADLAGRRVLVQGVGDVGAPLARDLAAAGAELVLADADAERARRLAAELGAETVAAEAVYDARCDVFAPCAVGAVINPDTVPRLACRVVAGSANNQLAGDDDAEALHRRGILYAPDYVANAGGAIAFGRLAEAPETPRHELMERVGRIRGICDEILAEAAERGESPLHAARRRVRRILDAGRGGS